ncbi:lipopolysaccharide export system protein LptA [Bartonella sp. A1379B]|nr:lipopolysaccharide export system protein LptA [Bartonella sp. A1379B]AQX22272.1 lipopolysaccharide export system protein LptA [Bartonella sp. 11B]AQX24445.1 lipopolysaccharide export system protein LptA [Bartonella sp. 114]AQX24718.1 lipopolysaccharide export system protein LptA [Bartonella sp. Coyote22sub2]
MFIEGVCTFIREKKLRMKTKKSCKEQVSLLTLSLAILGSINGYAAVTHFGIDGLNGQEPMELHADSLEIRDKEGIAVFNGDVSVMQGERLLRTSKLVIYYNKAHITGGINQLRKQLIFPEKIGSTDIQKVEALGEVYIKTAKQTATGDKAIFDGQSNMIILTGNNVVLTDGDNVAQGCILTANMKTGKASLEGCKTPGKKNRVSIILKSSSKNGR